VAGKGYEVFLPTYLSKRRWSDRAKEVKSPLFPGYFFCRFDVHKRLPILVTPGVIGVVGQGRVPVPVNEAEVLSIKNIVSSGAAVEPWPYIEVGQRVRIDDHALRGLEGILVGRKGTSASWFLFRFSDVPLRWRLSARWSVWSNQLESLRWRHRLMLS